MSESKKNVAQAAKTARTNRSAPTAASPKTKIDALVALMRRPKGATLEDLMRASGWQAHSVRGAISGAIKKKLKLAVSSTRDGDTRLYRIGS